MLILFWALCVKIVRDPDEDLAAFRLFSILLVIASVLYIVPQIYGLEAADQAYLGDLPSKLISSSNLEWRQAALLGELRALRDQRRRDVRPGGPPAARPEDGGRDPRRSRLTDVPPLRTSRGGSR